MKHLVLLLLIASVTPAFAESYPVQGKWGESTSTDKDPVDCSTLRTIDFRGERRFDSGGSVRDFRALAVERQDGSSYRVTEEFGTGQVRARNAITLNVAADPDRVELTPQRGSSIRLRKCR